jgi:Protein of unknown function (DUF3726)
VTRAGAAILSHNEVEQLCLKAARGAGMAWGLAEEAGFAAAWLADRGLDGPGALLRLLEQAAQPVDPLAITTGVWRAAAGGSLCPIATGAALCDFALLQEAGTGTAGLQIGPVRQVLLLLPFVCVFAAMHGKAARVTLSAGSVLVQPTGVVTGDTRSIETAGMAKVHLVLAPAHTDAPLPVRLPHAVAASALAHLNQFALHTTVPPSALSRAGAGAEVDDND